MSSARDFTFFVVGSFDVEKIKPLIATYLASLPVGEIPVAFKDEGVRPIKGVVKKCMPARSRRAPSRCPSPAKWNTRAPRACACRRWWKS
jgi:hypothetical protein